MDVWTLIAGLALIIGIVAGIVQVLDYLEKRREKKQEPTAEEVVVPSPPVPSNLPPRGEFIGRGKEKVRVREALSSRWPLTCIDGIGGIGKTALALEVAGECLWARKGEMPADGIPTFDGFIWTTAKDRELALNDVLDAIARTLDYPGIAQQPPEEKQESVCRLLQTKPYLLIVDNFETVTDDAVRDFLLRLPEPTKALITSREQKLRQAWAVSLKGLEQEEALTLIRSEGRRLGLASVERGEEWVLLRLYKATGGAPLAIKWAVGQIKQKGQSLDTVLTALHEARGDIFEEVFARSWSLLSEETRCILMVMPIFAASASCAAIEVASDVHHYALDEGLGQLVEMWLVEATDELDAPRRRYSIHPLTRAYAGAKLGWNEEFELSVWERTSNYFLAFARSHGGYQNWEGFDELQKELVNILAVIDWCYEREQWQRIIEFSNHLPNFLRVRGYWDQRITLCIRGFEASKRAKAMHWVGRNAYWVGRTYYYRGDFDTAQTWAEESLKAMEQEGDEGGIAYAKRLLGNIACKRGDFDQALSMLLSGLETAKQLDKKFLLARLRCDLGELAYDKRDYAEAERWLNEALVANTELHDQEMIAWVLGDLGTTFLAKEDWREARRLFNQGLATAEAIRRRDIIGRCKQGLAVVEHKANNYNIARTLALEAIEIFERLGLRKDVEKTQALVERIEGKLPMDSGANSTDLQRC